MKPEYSLLKVLKVQSRPIKDNGYSIINGQFNPEAKYLRYRTQNIK